MWPLVAFAEIALLYVLWSSTIAVIVLMCKRKSPSKLYNRCPPLFLVLVATLLLAIANCFMLVPWLALSSGFFTLNKVQSQIAFLLGIAVIPPRTLYDLQTLALFLQRIFIILLPVKRCGFTTILSVVNVLVVSAMATVLFVVFVPALLKDTSIPENCFSSICMSQSFKIRPGLTVIRLISSSLIILSGSVFLLLYSRQKTHQNESEETKFYVMLRMFFYLRIFLEVIPFLMEFLLLKTMNISVAQYVGPFGSFGGAVDALVTTLLYCRVLFPRKVVHQVSSTTRLS